MRPLLPGVVGVKFRLRRTDNWAERKIALLLCNQGYGEVKDADGFPVGEVFEASHKTMLMESFLKDSLGFDAVQTHADLD